MDRLITGSARQCADKTWMKNQENMSQNEADINGFDELIEAREYER